MAINRNLMDMCLKVIIKSLIIRSILLQFSFGI